MHINDFGIGVRLLFSFGFILSFFLIITIFVGVVGKRNFEGFINHDNASMVDSLKARDEVYAQAIAIRNIGLMSDVNRMNQERKKIDEYATSYQLHINKIEASARAKEEQQLIKEIKEYSQQSEQYVKKAISLVSLFRPEEASALLANELDPVQKNWIDALDRLNEYKQKKISSVADEVIASQQQLNRMTMLGGICITLLGFFLAWVITRSIVKPLGAAIAITEKVSHGDLTSKIDIIGRDEINQLLSALSAMNANLQNIVSNVRSGADSVSSAAKQIAQGNDDLSQRTQEQASTLEKTASNMEEMTATVKQNAENASQANQLARSAREQAERGGEVVSQAVAAMGEINQSSRKIADIISVIDEIAFQTNLLALNAAVEAARAGEQGRGFAVVASEVRNLAQRSAAAAKEIKGLINDSVERVEVGSKLVDRSGQTLSEIVESVKKVTDIVAEIAAASREQSAGIDQVSHAIMQMDEVTQQNAALVEEASAASRAMQEQAENLANQMGFFHLRQIGNTPKNITTEHYYTNSASLENSADQVIIPMPINKRPAGQARNTKVIVDQKSSASDAGWQEF